MKAKLWKAFFVAIGLLLFVVLCQELYRQGGMHKVAIWGFIPGAIGIMLAVLFPYRFRR